MKLLNGIKVVNLAVNLPGPAAARRLLKLGARVVKVEPPGGDPMFHYSPAWYEQLADGQEIIRIDLKNFGEKRQLDQLLQEADLLITANRPAALAGLAKAFGGEYGASRPIVDSEWVEHTRQVGTTGQTVSPKLYVACGISGAIQHLAGMKKSEFVVAINTDMDAPIGDVADVLVVADLNQLVPMLTDKISAL